MLNQFELKLDGGKVVFNRATASFSQPKYEVAGAIDGDAKTGWAVNPQFGKPHEAVFLLKNELLVKEEARLNSVGAASWGRANDRPVALVGGGW